MIPIQIDVKYYPPLSSENKCEHPKQQIVFSTVWRNASGNHLARFTICNSCSTMIVQQEIYE